MQEPTLLHTATGRHGAKVPSTGHLAWRAASRALRHCSAGPAACPSAAPALYCPSWPQLHLPAGCQQHPGFSPRSARCALRAQNRMSSHIMLRIESRYARCRICASAATLPSQLSTAWCQVIVTQMKATLFISSVLSNPLSHDSLIANYTAQTHDKGDCYVQYH